MQESESSAKKSKTHSSDYCDSSGYVPKPRVVTQLYDRGLDDNDKLVMQSRVSTCSFCHKQHTEECCKQTKRCPNCGSPNHFVVECPKSPYKNPTASVSTQFSRNRGYSTETSSQASKPGK
ncbi:hypothetical protein V6N12_012866 [Hibiscus sabdariffa]|uniref:CCHC-type domain-containing protein n=1 Tax=Hibiscus sabdariffa TaxID=183260 RepID=A0ABR2EFN0_9ROSI